MTSFITAKEYKLKAAKWRDTYTEIWVGSKSFGEILRIWKLPHRNWGQKLVKFIITQEGK